MTWYTREEPAPITSPVAADRADTLGSPAEGAEDAPACAVRAYIRRSEPPAQRKPSPKPNAGTARLPWKYTPGALGVDPSRASCNVSAVNRG